MGEKKSILDTTWYQMFLSSSLKCRESRALTQLCHWYTSCLSFIHPACVVDGALFCGRHWVSAGNNKMVGSLPLGMYNLLGVVDTGIEF
jgi:hypothetical protein